MEAVLIEIFRQEFVIYRALYKIKKSPELQSQADPILRLVKGEGSECGGLFSVSISKAKSSGCARRSASKCLTMYAALKVTW
jgi:hypothetical protein